MGHHCASAATLDYIYSGSEAEVPWTRDHPWYAGPEDMETDVFRNDGWLKIDTSITGSVANRTITAGFDGMSGIDYGFTLASSGSFQSVSLSFDGDSNLMGWNFVGGGGGGGALSYWETAVSISDNGELFVDSGWAINTADDSHTEWYDELFKAEAGQWTLLTAVPSGGGEVPATPVPIPAPIALLIGGIAVLSGFKLRSRS